MSIIAILTAGGTGTRTHQDLPKQFITVENKPIIIYTLEAFQSNILVLMRYMFHVLRDGMLSLKRMPNNLISQN